MAVFTADALRQPVGTSGIEMGSVDLGGMTVIAHKMPAGFDATELLKAAVGETLCTVPHYLVVTKGAVGVRYVDDGREEVARAGDVAYLPPGHTVWAEEDSELIEISPSDETAFLNSRIAGTGLLG